MSDQLRVTERAANLERAIGTAVRLAGKYGPRFAIVRDDDPATGGGAAYPFAIVTRPGALQRVAA